MMHLSDADLEFVFSMYDSGKALLANDAAREQWADETIKHLTEYGFTIELISEEIGEHDSYLARALDLLKEYQEEEAEEDSYYDDDETEDY
jgi:hypothetical protein